MLKRTCALDLTRATSLYASSARAKSPAAWLAAPSLKRSRARARSLGSCAHAAGASMETAIAPARMESLDGKRRQVPILGGYTKPAATSAPFAVGCAERRHAHHHTKALDRRRRHAR